MVIEIMGTRNTSKFFLRLFVLCWKTHANLFTSHNNKCSSFHEMFLACLGKRLAKLSFQVLFSSEVIRGLKISSLWVGFCPSGCFGYLRVNQVLLKVRSCPDKGRIESNKNNNTTALKYWNIHKRDLQWICYNPFSSLRFFVKMYRGAGNSVESL